ncbi:MAG TPA: BlaI/MecI/CopY family transcriptional regulator [Chitinophagales bacterium]|nr:BlaI/MecI/CopY family transcriptional regulator [Chitinophagales bacterium]HRK29117.1 BlaI/MecI/CopY family transcriptional regulator [Chitinophagales bacterium]
MSKILTPLELKVMNILWGLEQAFVNDVLEAWNEYPKPAYNTISTTLRILAEKGFIHYQAFGRTHRYYPLISQPDYQKNLMSNIIQNAFSGSVSSLVSAIVDNEYISDAELAEIQELLNKSRQ